MKKVVDVYRRLSKNLAAQISETAMLECSGIDQTSSLRQCEPVGSSDV
jgi:hypothetical protein